MKKKWGKTKGNQRTQLQYLLKYIFPIIKIYSHLGSHREMQDEIKKRMKRLYCSQEMDPTGDDLSKLTWSQKDKYHLFPLMHGSLSQRDLKSYRYR